MNYEEAMARLKRFEDALAKNEKYSMYLNIFSSQSENIEARMMRLYDNARVKNYYNTILENSKPKLNSLRNSLEKDTKNLSQRLIKIPDGIRIKSTVKKLRNIKTIEDK